MYSHEIVKEKEKLTPFNNKILTYTNLYKLNNYLWSKGVIALSSSSLTYIRVMCDVTDSVSHKLMRSMSSESFAPSARNPGLQELCTEEAGEIISKQLGLKAPISYAAKCPQIEMHLQWRVTQSRRYLDVVVRKSAEFSQTAGRSG